MQYWTCTEEWPGSTVWVIGGGPSVRGLDLSSLAGRKVIAINSSFENVPFADFLFFGDSRWFWHNKPKLKRFKGRLVTCAPPSLDPKCLRMQKVKPPPGLCEQRDSLAMQYTSYQAAINLAVHLGAVRIVAIGLDGKPDGVATHHHEPHPWPQRPECWSMQIDSMRHVVKPLAKRGIEVFNANPDSAYEWWPKMSFAKCLARFA